MLVWLIGSVEASGAFFASALGRGAIAAAVSLAAVLLAGRPTIAWLRGRCRDPNISPSPRLRELHAAKAATPTMGGLLVVAAIVLALLLFADLENRFVQIALALVGGLTLLGILDDARKIVVRRGLSAGWKLLAQTAIAALAAFALDAALPAMGDGNTFFVPLVGAIGLPGWTFVPLATFVLVASTNAVNLTDGLDGLAAGCVLFALAAMSAAVALAGSSAWAGWLGVPHVSGAAEMLVPAGAALGATAGFLWFNRHPARVFFGDTGSLPLGGLVGLLAVVARQEILLVIVAGVFVVETLSVIVQLSTLRLLGLRLLRCAPLHHHFQFGGWSEPKIVARFWIAAACCAVVGAGSLAWPTGNDSDAAQLRPTDPPSLRSAAVEQDRPPRQNN